MDYPLPCNEDERLAALHELGILGSCPDPVIDTVCKLAKDLFSVPIAAVTLLSRDQQWFKAREGLDFEGTPRSLAFCNHTILGDDVFVVRDAAEDCRFTAHPLVTGEPGIRFYAGAPVALDAGLRLGALCLLDDKPRAFSALDRERLRDLAAIVRGQFELHRSRKETKARSDALALSEARLRLALEATHLGTWELSDGAASLALSLEARALLGLPSEGDIDRRTLLNRFHRKERRRVTRLVARAISRPEGSIDVEIKIRRKSDREDRWLSVRGRSSGAEGSSKLIGTFQDITELHVRAEQQQGLALLGQVALQDGDVNDLFRAACSILSGTLSVAATIIMMPDPAGERLVLAAGSLRRRGIPDVGLSVPMEGSLSGEAFRAQGPVAGSRADPEMWDVAMAAKLAVQAAVAVGIGDISRRFGTIGVASAMPRRFTEAETSFLQAVAFVLGATLERRETVASLRLRDRALEAVEQGIAICDATHPDLPLVYVNPAIARNTGYCAADLLDRSSSALFSTDDDRSAWRRMVRELDSNGSYSGIVQSRRRNGSPFQQEISASEVLDHSGRRTHFVTVHTDVTQRLKLEGEVRQGQKMEAIGKLTGGVAHDFNNLLTVILGNAELIADMTSEPTLKPLAEMIVEAAERGADTVQRLLAFGRRQALEPENLDVNAVVRALTGLLQRSLGEDIALRTQLASTDLRSYVDRSQLENAVLNLAVNARDAMPRGGTVCIRTRDVTLGEDRRSAGLQPGAYVSLVVEDTGCGIPAPLLDQVFEPFFTTKDVGKGTGLGLSMVYGFVQQSGGLARIDSEVGRGTSVELLIPRSAVAAATTSHRARSIPEAGCERVLVVEDQDDLRAFVQAQLTSLGYDVTSVPDAHAAVQHLENSSDFDLLFTDIIMPGSLDGAQLAERASIIRPNLKILFTSGYSDRAMERNTRFLDGSVALLKKPYKRAELSAAVRAALASP